MTCAEDCRFASALVTQEDSWLWCSHPAAAVRLVRRDHDCARFAPQQDGDRTTDHRESSLSGSARGEAASGS
jgi:hypothetical protein